MGQLLSSAPANGTMNVVGLVNPLGNHFTTQSATVQANLQANGSVALNNVQQNTPQQQTAPMQQGESNIL